PAENALNFNAKKIVLTFDEYVQLDQVRENLLVSPVPEKDPYVDYKLKTVTIKINDTLSPNTTYSINLGNAVNDVNEKNIYRNLTYTFSTGNYIDSLTLSGNVQLAETGAYDSTLTVLLYNNLIDSAVETQKPRYIAKVDSSGNFYFKHLASGTYNYYALKDGDGNKFYSNPKEIFAFADNTIEVNNDTTRIKLYAFAQEPEKPAPTKQAPEKKLKYISKVTSEEQDIQSNLVIDFNKKLKTFDSLKILLTDTLNNQLDDYNVSLDTTQKKVTVNYKWQMDSFYRLIILEDFGSDSTGLKLEKTDTLKFKAKGETDYGSLKINFKNLDTSQKTVLQFIKGTDVVKSYKLDNAKWSEQLFDPGEYQIRILYDTNDNGKWDPGDYKLKGQPEIVYPVKQKLSIRANWENERDIELPK
ncbi:MAG: Ig-like domain-containing domain, partial [Ginsengibacter sp.]